MFNGVKSIFTQYKGLSRSIYIIFIARVVTNMGAFIWPLLTLILSKKMGYSPTLIAIISTSTFALFIPANIIGGKLADKYNKKKIIILFDSISIIFFMACAFIEPGILMTVFFILAGLFANIEGPSFEALLVESTKPSEREKAFSLSYLGHNLGFMFGIAIGGLLFNDHLNIAFIIDGMTTLMSTILIILFVTTIKTDTLHDEEKNEYEDSEADHIDTFSILKKRKSVFLQIIVFSIGAFIYDQWSFTLPLYLGELFGDEGAEIFGFIGSFNGFIVIIFTPIITVLLSRLKELPKIMIGMGLYSISYLIIKDDPLRYVFFIMIFAFTIGEIVNTLGSSPFISRRVPASHRGRVSSYMNIGYMFGGMGGRLVAGLFIDNFGYDATFNLLATLGFICVVLVALNYKIDKKMFPKLYAEKVVSDEID